MIEGDTICAISTPTGLGGLAVLRISGPQAADIMRQTCEFLPIVLQSHHAYFGSLRDELGHTVDQVVATYFAEGKSFTGEQTIEISCHGSSYIADRILNLMVASGARLADRGEFTARAFMNGKMDLAQAEAVLDLIESKTKGAARQALRQLEGGVSTELHLVEEELTWCLAHLEASIDFSTEGLEIVTQHDLLERFGRTKLRVEKLRDSYQKGRLIREGARLAIVGKPNVGKSSLLNALLQEDRAIVTSEPGTTRDVITGEMLIGPIRVQFMDTAGLRTTQDFIEQEGIARGRKTAKQCDLVLYLFSLADGLDSFDLAEVAKYEDQSVLLLGTKSDLVFPADIPTLLDKNAERAQGASIGGRPALLPLAVSVKNSKSMDALKATIASSLRVDFDVDETLISRARHHANLEKSLENLDRGALLIKQNLSSEFIALELKEALIKIQEILGKRYDDEILDKVFKEFCIGK